MARPKKTTVDYFPHNCDGGKTIFILQQSFGNDGYAFWFKLLELLGKTNNHYLDCRNNADFKFLQAITHTDEDLTCKILDLLCSLEAIDKELWENRIIWCQNFVDNIKDVYLNRRVEIPSKPNFYKAKPINHPDNESTSGNLQIISPQSKVKETKVKETKVNSGNSKNEFPLVKTNSSKNGHKHIENVPDQKEVVTDKKEIK